MSQDINLNSQEWRDLIFQGKNKNYGAYDIRSTSDKRHFYALIILTLFVATIIISQLVVKTVSDNQQTTVVKDDFGKIVVIDHSEEKPIKKEPDPVVIPQQQPMLKSSLAYVPPKPVSREEIKQQKETTILTNDEIMQTNTAIATKTVISNKKDGDLIDDLKEVVVAPPKKEQDDNIIVEFAEQKPEFPGGQAELMKYLGTNLRYPAAAIESEVEGRVVVQFVVSKTGAISNVKILRSLHPSCDKEAERLIKNMPSWIPGKQNGNPVNVYYTIPIRFMIEKK